MYQYSITFVLETRTMSRVLGTMNIEATDYDSASLIARGLAWAVAQETGPCSVHARVEEL